MNFFWKTMLFTLVCVACVNLHAQTKIAVLTDKGLENYADLLTVELSKQKDLNVIERTEIDRVLKEQEIASANIAESYLKLGKLLKADGLVMIKKYEFRKKEFLISRLVAVNQGVVLSGFSSPLPPEKIENWSMDVSAKFAPYLNKLGVLQDKAVPISILNIRAPIDTPEMRLLEKEFTLALAFRLIQEKDLFVLERWKMEKLAWEKDIDLESSPFWTGSYLLDGSIELMDKENVRVKVRLRKKDGEEKTIEATGIKGKLSEITEKLTRDLLKQIGKTQDRIPWDSKKEAEQYLKEAEWACQAGLYDEAVSAVDNASALGLKGKDVIFIKIKSYSMLAYPTFREWMPPWDDLYVENIIDVKSTDKYLDAATYALEAFICTYLSEKPEGTVPWVDVQKLNWRHLGTTVVLNASRVLRSYYDQKEFIGKADKLTVLRRLIRIVVDDLVKRELVPGDKWMTAIFVIYPQYIPFWYDSPQDCINAYRRLFTIELPDNSKHNEMFKYEAVRDFRRTPFIIDWSGQISSSELEGLCMGLMDELSKSENLKYQMISLIWHKSENSRKLSDVINDKTIDDKQKDILRGESLKRMEDSEEAIRIFVWNNREELIFKNEIKYKLIIIDLIQASRLYSPFCFNLLKYILDKCISERIDLPVSTSSIFELWMWRGTSKDEVNVIQKMIEDYRNSLDVTSLKKQSILFDAISKKFKDFHPEISPDGPSEGLSSCKLWTPFQFEVLEPGRNFRILETVTRGNKIYLLSYDEHMGQRVIMFDLDSNRLDESVKLPEIAEHAGLMDGSDDYLIVISGNGKVLKYERHRKIWSQLALPQKYFSSMALKDDLLYLGYSDIDRLPDNGYYKDTLFQNSGILEVDLKKDTFKIITSSTRKPAENPLDDMGNYNVLNIYYLKEGRVLFNVDVARTALEKDGKSKIIFIYDRNTGKLKQDFAHAFTRIFQLSDNDYLMVSDLNLGIYHLDGSGLDYICKNLSEKDKINSGELNRFYRLNENTCGLLRMSKIKKSPELLILNKDFPMMTIPVNLSIPSKDIKTLKENYHFDGFFNFPGREFGLVNNQLSTEKYIIFCGSIAPGFWYIFKKDIDDYINKSIADKKAKQ
ncbi:MAG: CsgG/HfaB family protein [Victivallales bacterium]